MSHAEAGASEEQRRAIHEVLEQGLARIVYQPIVSFRSGSVFAYEALARPEHPAFDGPVALFRAAVAERVTGRLGRFLRQLAIERCPDHRLFLNLHPEELDDGFVVRPDDPIFVHGQEVYLEITESMPLTHYVHCHSALAEVRSRGVFLCVDDLGAGYSNLRYIADLEPAIVKLDRALITSIHHSERLLRLVRSLVRLCEQQGAEVVAEGIETADEHAAAREVGVHFGQGYFIARPAFPPPVVHGFSP